MKYWCDNSPVRTHFLNAWSILFPAWEKVFAAVANHHKPNIDDLSLVKRIEKFVDQETAHANAHHKHNERSEITELEKQQERRAQVAMRKLGHPMWLATMVSIEHLAACCSRTFLKLYGHREEREFKLFAWHAREELEHKSLAMDLWTSLGHDRKTLRTALIANQKFIWSFVLLYVYKKLKEEKLLLNPFVWFEIFVVGFIVFGGIFVPSFKVYSSKFHPDNQDDSIYMVPA